MAKLSFHQENSLKQIKSEHGTSWFTCSQIFRLAIRRPYFTLETLYQKGLLLRKSNTNPYIFSEDMWLYSMPNTASSGLFEGDGNLPEVVKDQQVGLPAVSR